MASPLDLRGRVVITNGASGTLNKIKGDLNAIGGMTGRMPSGGMFAANAWGSLTHNVTALNRAFVGLRASVLGSGFAVAGVLASTKTFSESNFGYGFARITEFMKNGKLDIEAWKKALRDAANEARTMGKDFGTTPETTMKVMEETEKLGFKGRDSESVRNSALKLHLTEPTELPVGESAKFLGAVVRGYEKQMLAKAAKDGVNVNDADAMGAWKSKYINDLAGKAAFAGATSALGPADIVEGMRQFAPQWAAMGIPYEFALAALMHGADFGFRAPELGTAYKSMANKAMKPSAEGLRVMGNLKDFDRSKYFKAGPVDPQTAVRRLNSLLDGQLFAGKDGNKARSTWTKNLRAAYDSGEMTGPEFQEKLTQQALKRLGRGWEGRADDVREAVANSTLMPNGDLDLPGYLKGLRDAGATVADIATIFEGRHVARNTPLFEFYENLIATYEGAQQVGGEIVDAGVEGRKVSEAGELDQLGGAWGNLMTKLRESEPIKMVTGAVTSLLNAAAQSELAVTALAVAITGLAVGATVATAGGALLFKGLAAGAVGAAALRRFGLGAVLAGSLAASAGGAAGVGQVAGRGALALGGKVLSRLWLPALLGFGAYEAYQGYQKDGVLGAILNPLTLGLYSGGDVQASEMPANGEGDAGAGAAGGEGQYSAAVSAAQQAANEIRAAMRVDLTAEGQAAAQSFANGIIAGTGAAVSAMSSMAARAKAAASSGVQLNTGPNMQPAR